jgi:hypothetical protein
MYVCIGLSVATGLPWEYFAEQSDAEVSTYVDILKQAQGKRSGAAPGGTRTTASKPRQMSG